MFQGILIFALVGIVLIGAFAAVLGRRRAYQESAGPEDRLTDEEFRRIEYGDDV